MGHPPRTLFQNLQSLSPLQSIVGDVHSASLVAAHSDVRLLVDVGEGRVERLRVAVSKAPGWRLCSRMIMMKFCTSLCRIRPCSSPFSSCRRIRGVSLIVSSRVI